MVGSVEYPLEVCLMNLWHSHVLVSCLLSCLGAGMEEVGCIKHDRTNMERERDQAARSLQRRASNVVLWNLC